MGWAIPVEQKKRRADYPALFWPFLWMVTD
ncbi:hypothetical protein TSACC_21220 [Terrimicrobium sacchariphilum]|uniref:Uncharacterized protein n=1 Tax=Terrimicrobium sacchariphilum TaxID=690879 RepID=A0A146G7X1_TERSA|nr:hypothetical protein TSACC_21220 [Terrimicrobium sacchariphilum]